MPVRVAVDAMGGDHAPGAIVRGAVQALDEDPDLHVSLVGREAEIERELSLGKLNGVGKRLRIVHASQVIEMDAPPVEALRANQDSSLARMAELGATGEIDALVSAGNTGAFAAVCQLKLKPLACVTRPGIAVTIPSFHGPFVLCDVGANIHAKPRHLYEYAIMATLYAEQVVGIDNPRVALISIGEERAKGTDLVKQTHDLLKKESSINFVGNAEGRELFEGRYDVGICDGFVGNIVLKFSEGLAEGLFRTIAREFEHEEPLLKDRFSHALERVSRRHHYSRYGGAPLLGVNGVCVICHGRSNELAVCNAVKMARSFAERGFNEAVTARLG